MTTSATHPPLPAAEELTPDERRDLLLVLASQAAAQELTPDEVDARLAGLTGLPLSQARDLFQAHLEARATADALMDDDALRSEGDGYYAALDELARRERDTLYVLANGGSR